MVWIAVAVGLAAAAVSELLIASLPRWLHPVREPAGDGAARLEALCRDVGIDVGRVLVRRTSSDGTVAVQVIGLPGRRELLVTEPALRELGDDVLRALLAAEAERVRGRIEFFQSLSAGLAVGIVTATYVTSLEPLEAFLGAWTVTLLAMAVARRLRYRADRRAAATVGEADLVAALERVADLRGESTEPSAAWRSVFDVEPSLGDRLGRLAVDHR